MKTLASLSLLLALPLASCSSLGGDGVEWVDYGDDPMANPAYMEAMMAAATPGAEHERLAARAGDWFVEGTVWMEPGAEPMPMDATATIESYLGGRYTMESFSSDFMGMPFEGRLVSGFDNVTGEHWAVWHDGMSTGCFYSRGTETEPGHVELVGTANDILTPEGREFRMTITDNGDGTHTMRMYDTRPGTDGEFQSMELHYTRG